MGLPSRVENIFEQVGFWSPIITRGDAVDAIHDHQIELADIVKMQPGTYLIREERLAEIKIQAEKSNNKYLRQGNKRAEYVESKEYYIFRHLR